MTDEPAATPMVPLPGGTFRMGSTEYSLDETPVHERSVKPFAIDVHPVTTAQFAAFITATGYITVAERAPDAADFPGADLDDLVPGGLVFTPTAGPVDLRDWRRWWRWQPGASWRFPEGAGVVDALAHRADHPVVMVAYADAAAYAVWAGKRLPTEAEFEYAARGGLDGARFAWGDEERPNGTVMVNRWHGAFPYRNDGSDGWRGTSPVGTFPANAFGLLDMTGNVWEWTTDAYVARHLVPGLGAPRPETRTNLIRPSTTDAFHDAQRVLKGGSHLCSPDYCLRYRPAARSAQSEDSATTHIGFRCAADSVPEPTRTIRS